MIVRALLSLVLIGFLALTARALLAYGYLGFFETATANWAIGLLFIDLVICLGLIGVWIWRDARRLRISPWPYLAAGAALGAAGPLLYLKRRPKGVLNPSAARAAGESRSERPWGWGPTALRGEHVPEDVSGPERVALLAILLGFSVVNVVALDRYGYASLVFHALANEATELVLVDLTINLILIAVWMIRDARSRRAVFVPFLPLAAFFGSIGPLLYLLVREWRASRQWVAGTLALVAATLAMTLGSGHADLRNERVRSANGEDAARLGREKLERLAQRHGLEAWKKHSTMETVARDVWPGGGPWWPEDDQRFRSQALLGTFTSRAELLDGEGRGEIWGLQAWAPYKRKGRDSSLEFLSRDDGAITFYLPSLQYFNELPFRLRSAPVVLDAGETRHRGRRYDLVLVTWRSPEPQPDLDQYLLWIDRETGLLAKARYTVREAVPQMPPLMQKLALPLVAGTIHYEDYRKIDGVQVPFVQTVTLPPPELTRYPLEENYFHRLELEEARFDSIPRDALLPDSARGEPGDRKPEF